MGYKVLVVDDNIHNSKLIEGVLSAEKTKYDIFFAENGQEGLAVALQWQPDLIITDLAMPVMDGHEMLSQLRQMPEISSDMKVIVSSASVFESDRQKSLKAGANDFLPKPIQKDVLLGCLEKHLDLEWVYDQQSVPAKQARVVIDKATQIPQSTPIIPPSPEDVALLHDLSRKGLLNDLLQEIERIEDLDVKFSPFTQTLREYAKGFKLRQIKAFIEEYL